MDSLDVIRMVKHYQKSIEKNQENKERLLHCVKKLEHMPIKVEHLQETGVGKTVNSLRKFDGTIGKAANDLVTAWKKMVMDDDNALEKTHYTNTNQHNECNVQVNIAQDGNGGGANHIQLNNHNKPNYTEEKPKHSDKREHSGDKRIKHSEYKHKHNHSGSSREHHSSKNTHENGSASRHKGSTHSHKQYDNFQHSSDEENMMKLQEKENSVQREQKERHDHKDKSRSSKNEKVKNKDQADVSGKDRSKKAEADKNDRQIAKKRKHTDSDEEQESLDDHKGETDEQKIKKKHKHKSSSSSSSKHRRKHEDQEKTKERSTESKDKDHCKKSVSSSSDRVNHVNPSVDADVTMAEDGDVDNDGIDSSMGANFADVLGMLNMPMKKSKKSGNVKNSTSPQKSKDVAGKSHAGTTSSIHRVNGVAMRTATSRAPSTSTTSSNYTKNTKPELLTSSAKLEPLDPSIALELPVISNNYKPLPVNPTVMDCVYNSSAPSTSAGFIRPQVRTMTDSEVLTHSISSKNMRTKIYSGAKTGQVFQVPPLFDLCIRLLQKNVEALEYTGGVPYELLRPVIERCTPQQLFAFEEYNPYIMEDTDELWKQHVQRLFRTEKRKEMESWREMYFRCQEHKELKLSQLAENIKKSQKEISAPVRKTQLAFVDSLVKPPRNVQRKQEQYGTKSKLIATPAARVAALSVVTPNAAKTGDVRLRVSAAVRDAAQVSNSASRIKKTAPLMAKTLQFFKRRKR